ncbi:MAG: type I-C CRISPR-associated protein Cas8c/Csd1 [Opitutales bacterium]|nr:type I-C CRISPR-associated protein Cas8c/Csd1 [Opitutales bacterium]
MILQALHDLHDRLAADPAYDVAPEGFSLQQISFVIVLEPDGTLVGIQDHRLGEGNQRRAQTHRVPGTSKPPGAGINPCLFWDNTGYLLGYKVPDKDEEKARKDADRAIKTFEASLAHHLAHEKSINQPAFSAVCRFLESWTPESAADHPQLPDLATGFGVFQIRGATHFVHEEPAIEAWWQKTIQSDEADSKEDAFCLITGRLAPIAELHEPKIKGVKDAQGAGALIVSFNTNAYESFGKSSGQNAPVSKDAATRYCKTLNALLSSRRHRLRIGDATTVFWTDAPAYTKTESVISEFFGGGGDDAETESEDHDDEPAQRKQLLESLHAALRALRSGGEVDSTFLEEKDRTFYILGLTGQAGGRIGVRFWFSSPIEELLRNLARHHEDLAIQRPSKNKDGDLVGREFPTIKDLLSQTCRNENTLPNTLIRSIVAAILTGGNYPNSLALKVIGRIKADRAIDPNMQKDSALETFKARESAYLRAAILKSYLNRNYKMNISTAIDKDRTEPAYHLGRLFAVYEMAQKHAHDWKLERTIRETMYSSASATPLSVFGRLERLHHHHTAKKSHPRGSSLSYADIVSEIQQRFKGRTPIYPAKLDLVQQSLFAVGYYHQHQYFRDLSMDKSESENA